MCPGVPLSCLPVLRFELGLAGVLAIDLILWGLLCMVRWHSGKWLRLNGLLCFRQTLQTKRTAEGPFGPSAVPLFLSHGHIDRKSVV